MATTTLYNFIDIHGNVIEENLHATPDTHGLMCPQDKAKLATIEEGANKTIVDSALSSASANPVQNKVVNEAITTHTGNKSNPHGVTLSQLGLTATKDELNYVDGVTSNIQTQLNAKAASNDLDNYYTKSETDELVLITEEELNEIFAQTIEVASDSGVKF